MRCPKCALINPGSAAVCGGCGYPLPRQPADSHSSQAERRRLSVVFCDLVGSTELSGQLDPEDLHDLTRRYQQACAAVIERHEGQVAQFLGDGILAYFGYPVAHEDDALRAVRAALELVRSIPSIGAEWGQRLQVRVAIHTGLAVVGLMAEGPNPDPLAIIGETPNIAARLRSVAEPGTVVISADTYKMVEGFFVCRGLGATVLKGLASPLELYSVIDEGVFQSRFERAVAAGLTPFVGRETEIAALAQRWELAKGGNGQVVMIGGEAGIGKSRLIRELKQRTGAWNVTELECRCSPYHRNSVLYPVTSLLASVLQFERGDNDETKLAKLESGLEQFGGPLTEALPLFAALLSLRTDAQAAALEMTPQRRKQKTLEAAVAWLMKAAEREPVRVIIEDLHWADSSTLELIDLLIAQVSRTRLFVGLAFRSDFLPPWRLQSHVAHLVLNRLSPAATELMIDGIAGDSLPSETVGEISRKTEGVPLFVEELTRMVLESASLPQKDPARQPIDPPPLAIPSTLYESLMARLDRLGLAKEVAQLAATIGREFSYELLRHISPFDEAKLNGALNKLVDAELLDQHVSASRTSYSFRHALIRDAAYESLLKSQRRQYHHRLAEVLRDRFADTVESQPELIATHYAEAGLAEQAIPYWERAGQRALERSANQEAVRHFTVALESLKSMPETIERLRRELALRINLGAALISAKGFSSLEAQRVYTRARELSKRVGQSPEFFRVLWGQWINYASRAEYEIALELGEQCLQLAQGVRDPALLIEAHHALGVSYCVAAEFSKALEHLDQAIALYDPEKHASHAYIYGQDPAAICHIHAAWCLWFLGYPDQALKRNEQGLALARTSTHPGNLATTAAFGALPWQLCRNSRAVHQLAETAVRISAEHNLAYSRGMGSILAGWALARQGRREEGKARMRQGLEGLRTADAVVMVPYFSSLLAEVYLETGQAKEGLSLIGGIDATREPYWEAELYRIRGELILKQCAGQPSQPDGRTEAEKHFLKALAIARARKEKSLQLRAASSLSRLWMREGKLSAARALMAEIFGWFTEGFDTLDLREAKALVDELGNRGDSRLAAS